MLNPKEIIVNLKPCHYRYNDKKDLGNKVHYGFIAQDLLDSFGEDYAFVKKEASSDYYVVNYIEFIAPIVSVLKDQQKEIEELREEIKKLKEGKKI